MKLVPRYCTLYIRAVRYSLKTSRRKPVTQRKDVKKSSRWGLKRPVCLPAKEYHGGEERSAEEPETPLPRRPSLLVPDPREALFRPRLR